MPSHISPLPTPPTRDDPINFPTRADAFVLAQVAFAAQANVLTDEVNTNAAIAAAAAITAVNAPGTSSVSSASLAIGNGVLGPFNTTAGKNYVVGMWVTVARTSDPTKWMVAPITAYNSSNGALTVNVQFFNGAGTFTDWTISLSPPIGFPAAAAAQIWAGLSNVVALTPAALFAAAAPVAVADAATVTLDFSAGLNWSVASFGGNRTLANPTNQKAGQSGVIAVSQDATGSRTLSFGTNWKFPGGAPSLTSTPGATDLISYYVLNPGVILATLSKAFA